MEKFKYKYNIIPGSVGKKLKELQSASPFSKGLKIFVIFLLVCFIYYVYVGVYSVHVQSKDGDFSFERTNFAVNGPISWDALPESVQEQFLNSTPKCNIGSQHIIKSHYFIDGRKASSNPGNVANCLRPFVEFREEKTIWKKAGVDHCVDQALKGEEIGTDHYPNSAKQHYKALEKYSIKGKNILVGGAVSPWVECIAIAYKAKTITTADYNLPIYDGDEINFIHVTDMLQSKKETYGAIFSFSSIEHDGLGRYGDPLDPFGDVKAMDEFYHVLKPDGLLFLGIPLGADITYFNGHRIYGPCRFEMLLKRWKLLEKFGMNDEKSDHDYFQGDDWKNQPLLVLQKKN